MPPQLTTDNQTDVGQTIHSESNMPFSVQWQAEQDIMALQDCIRGDMTAVEWKKSMNGWQTSTAMTTQQAQTSVEPLRRLQSTNTAKFAEIVDSLENTLQVLDEHPETRRGVLQKLSSEIQNDYLTRPFRKVKRDLETLVYRSPSEEARSNNLETLHQSMSKLPEFGTGTMAETYNKLKMDLTSCVAKLAKLSPTERQKDEMLWRLDSAISNIEKTREKMTRLIKGSIEVMIPSGTGDADMDDIQKLDFGIHLVKHPLGQYHAWEEYLRKISSHYTVSYGPTTTPDDIAGPQDQTEQSASTAIGALTTAVDTAFDQTEAAFKAYARDPIPNTYTLLEKAIADLTPFETFSESLVRGEVFIDPKNTQSDDIPYLLNYGVPRIGRDVERLKKLVTDMERGSDQSDSAGR